MFRETQLKYVLLAGQSFFPTNIFNLQSKEKRRKQVKNKQQPLCSDPFKLWGAALHTRDISRRILNGNHL
jgi:hypothetical protein